MLHKLSLFLMYYHVCHCNGSTLESCKERNAITCSKTKFFDVSNPYTKYSDWTCLILLSDDLHYHIIVADQTVGHGPWHVVGKNHAKKEPEKNMLTQFNKDFWCCHVIFLTMFFIVTYQTMACSWKDTCKVRNRICSEIQWFSRFKGACWNLIQYNVWCFI